jgi:hypothetical protein
MKDEYRPFLDRIEGLPDGDRNVGWLVFADYLFDRGDELEHGVRAMVASGYRPAKVRDDDFAPTRLSYGFAREEDGEDYFVMWVKRAIDQGNDPYLFTLDDDLFHELQPGWSYGAVSYRTYSFACLALAEGFLSPRVRPTPTT